MVGGSIAGRGLEACDLTPTPLLKERGFELIVLVLVPLLLQEKGPGDEVAATGGGIPA
jgi:hypothetical protein